MRSRHFPGSFKQNDRPCEDPARSHHESRSAVCKALLSGCLNTLKPICVNVKERMGYE